VRSCLTEWMTSEIFHPARSAMKQAYVRTIRDLHEETFAYDVA
jgi:hypothetical protein